MHPIMHLNSQASKSVTDAIFCGWNLKISLFEIMFTIHTKVVPCKSSTSLKIHSGIPEKNHPYNGIVCLVCWVGLQKAKPKLRRKNTKLDMCMRNFKQQFPSPLAPLLTQHVAVVLHAMILSRCCCFVESIQHFYPSCLPRTHTACWYLGVLRSYLVWRVWKIHSRIYRKRIEYNRAGNASSVCHKQLDSNNCGNTAVMERS